MIRSSNSLLHRLESASQTGAETAVLAGSMSRQNQVDKNVADLLFNCLLRACRVFFCREPRIDGPWGSHADDSFGANAAAWALRVFGISCPCVESLLVA